MLIVKAYDCLVLYEIFVLHILAKDYSLELCLSVLSKSHLWRIILMERLLKRYGVQFAPGYFKFHSQTNFFRELGAWAALSWSLWVTKTWRLWNGEGGWWVQGGSPCGSSGLAGTRSGCHGLWEELRRGCGFGVCRWHLRWWWPVPSPHNGEEWKGEWELSRGPRVLLFPLL